jgi:hypothetical protein
MTSATNPTEMFTRAAEALRRAREAATEAHDWLAADLDPADHPLT